MKQIQLESEDTIRYYSDSDEHCFFSWLKSVPGLVSVIGSGQALRVCFAPPLGADAIRELTALFKRYALDTSVLLDRKQD